MKNTAFTIANTHIEPGQRQTVDIPLAANVTHDYVSMTAEVICGKQAGPTLFISAAIHGDEINGVEIIRRLLKQKQLKRLRGTLVAIPIVNVHGFITQTRYLPDGRDLNRSFPGSSKGSLTARVANTFYDQVISQCTHGIDLHTGARHRENLPQIRADLDSDENKRLAHAFGVPVIIDSKIRDGSLREVAGDAGIPVLLYEAGEALRFNEVCIRAGVRGILNVMRSIDMLPASRKKESGRKPTISHSTGWVRAPHSGILRSQIPLGGKAEKNSVLGVIADPLGVSEYQVIAPEDGIVIGRTNLPLANEGDALFHLARYKQVDKMFTQVESFQEVLEPDYENLGRAEGGEEPIQ